MSPRLRAVRRAALLHGSIELPLSLLWSVLGAGIYGSPLSGVHPYGLVIVALLFVLAGPWSLLPLAILARWWPRAAGASMVAGGLCAIVLLLHPFGLRFVAFDLWNDIRPVATLVSMVPMLLGILVLRAQPFRQRGSAIAALLVGAALAGALTEGTRRWEASLGWRTFHSVTFLAFAPDGGHLLAAGDDSARSASSATVSMIDTSTGVSTPIVEGTERHLLTPDRATLIMANADVTQLWDVRRARASRLGAFRRPMAVSATVLALTSKRGIQLADPATGRLLRTLDFETETQWLALSSDGRRLAVGAYMQTAGKWTPNSDVALWDVASSTVRRIPGNPDEEALRAQFSPDGTILAILAGRQSNSTGGRLFLRLWSVSEERELTPLEEPPALSAPEWFTPDGRVLITSSEEPPAPNEPPQSRFTLWDTATWRRYASIRGSGVVAWSPDSATLAALESPQWESGFPVVLWNVRDGLRRQRLGMVEFLPEAISFAPDGNSVAVGGTMRDGQVGHRQGRVALFQVRR